MNSAKVFALKPLMFRILKSVEQSGTQDTPEIYSGMPERFEKKIPGLTQRQNRGFFETVQKSVSGGLVPL